MPPRFFKGWHILYILDKIPLMDNYKTYYETVKYLESLSSLSDIKKYAKDTEPGNYLKKTKYFLDLIGNPQDKFKFIHITGTAGKGTTANLVHFLLDKNGHRSGLFTSPYATTSIEKIKVGKLLISPDDFCDIVDFLKPFIDKAYLECPYGPPSYFEIFLAIALVYFQRQKCEWVVLEVGMGGMYDATNIIKNPIVTAITNIGLDHTNVLGKTLTKIAKDKAGIIKKHSIFLTTEMKPHLLKILKNRVSEVGAKRFIKVEGENEELALAITKSIGLKTFSLDNAPKLSCRFEVMQNRPLVVIDGAHNPSKIKYSLAKIKGLKYDNLIVVLSIAEDKNHQEMIEEVTSLANEIYFTRFLVSERACASPKKLYNIYKKIKPKGKASVMLDPFSALTKILNKAKDNDLIFITGSFFLAGELRKYWIPEENILTKQTIN